MTADQYDPAETSTIGSSALASDTSTISHDYQQGVGRSLYGIMRSAGARLEQRVDVFRESRTRQSLFRRSNTACSVGEEDWGVYHEVDPLVGLGAAASKSLGILTWTKHSLLPSSESRRRTAPDIVPGIYALGEPLHPISPGNYKTTILAGLSPQASRDVRQAQVPSPSSGTSEDFAEFKSKSWRPPSPTGTLSSTQAVVNFPLPQFPSQSLPQPIRPAQQSVLPEAVHPTRVTTALKTRKRSAGLKNGDDGVSRNGIAKILTTEKRSGGISSPRRLSSDPIMLYWDDIIEPSNKKISWYVDRLGRRESLVNIKSDATVADILEALKSLHYPGSGLYLDERGYERPLLSSEVPAVIIRERGEQAGYCMEDSSVLLVGKRLQFLLRFFLKENEDCRSPSNLSPINFEDVNLSANGLFTVPSSLIKNASFIITLDLSRNPLKIIPREFFRFAARLRNLSLSNTGLTLESSSLKYARNLQSLNLSGNRLTNLSDACLHEIPSLAVLNLNDNLLQSLPDHIVYLRSLRILNISYNKFEEIPAETALLFALRILDVSFNRITQLPEMLGGLEYLEELVCAGNQITHMPENIIGLRKLRLLDCQWNRIERLGGVFRLPALRRLRADHNSLAYLELGDHGHPFKRNITKTADEMGSSSTSLLRFLSISYNRLTSLPASIGNLTHLEGLECSNNVLNDLPPSLGVLKKLRWLDLHNNCIRALPITLWDCESLQMLNLTNNMLDAWLNPWVPADSTANMAERVQDGGNSTSLRPPLVKILQVLHLGHNRLTATRVTTLTSLNGLRVLNLSFNRLRAIPPNFFRRLINLEELHVGGNELPDLGFEQDLLELYSLSKLYLNGNRLRTVPEELRRIKSLRILDLGSNELGAGDKIDWNWDWSSNNDLVYLNLSGNICLSPPVNLPRSSQTGYEASLGLVRSKFPNLFSLSYLVNVRSLGLLGAPNTIISSLDEDKVWVRHSTSIIGGMAYGIADTINPAGENRFLDLFCAIPAHPSCSLIALFGREVSNSDSPNHVPRYLYSHFADVFNEYLAKSNSVEVSLRRTFLQLNQDLFHQLQTRTIAASPNSQADGASAIVLYFSKTHLLVANVGDIEAVISRRGVADTLTSLHKPNEPLEKERILRTEGYISPSFLANEIGTSRSFGHFHLFPSVISTPDIRKVEISQEDEFVIVANRAFWELVTPQVAVDVAHLVLRSRTRPQDIRTAHIASQALRDLAIGCGASHDLVVIVIIITDISMPPLSSEPVSPPGNPDREQISLASPRSGVNSPLPPMHCAFVSTTISNVAEFVNLIDGMSAARRLFFQCLRRYLRVCGGFEIKADNQTLLCVFPHALPAIRWGLTCQLKLLDEPWPAEILSHKAGRSKFDAARRRIACGFGALMGIHSGRLYADESIDGRSKYHDPTIDRVVALQNMAQTGQIVCSSNVMTELETAFDTTLNTGKLDSHTTAAVRAIRETGVVVAAEVLGFEGSDQRATESVFYLYPTPLHNRHPVQSQLFSLRPLYTLVHTVGLLCLRLETLIEGKVFRAQNSAYEEEENANNIFYYADPTTLLPTISDQSSRATLLHLLNQFSLRILNAMSSLQM